MTQRSICNVKHAKFALTTSLIQAGQHHSSIHRQVHSKLNRTRNNERTAKNVRFRSVDLDISPLLHFCDNSPGSLCMGRQSVACVACIGRLDAQSQTIVIPSFSSPSSGPVIRCLRVGRLCFSSLAKFVSALTLPSLLLDYLIRQNRFPATFWLHFKQTIDRTCEYLNFAITRLNKLKPVRSISFPFERIPYACSLLLAA